MLIRLMLIFCFGIVLSACGGGMSELENAELAHKRDECIRKNPTSPGKATACENIREECERRRKKGVFAC
ncbi:MAG: hypothetical protein U5M23_13825 [Marinagarivorans sp.]|nr:hypothetical protein [Marinagarivorans sp.]